MILNVEFCPAVAGSRMRGRFLISDWGDETVLSRRIRPTTSIDDGTSKAIG